MPTEIFNQLKTLREGIAESLKKDPRYLTLHALDKSIAEIGGVLSASGLITAEAAAGPAAFSIEPGAITPAAPQANQTAQTGGAQERTPKSPTNGIGAPASTGIIAERHAEALGKPIGTTASKSTRPIEKDEGESDEEPEPAVEPSHADIGLSPAVHPEDVVPPSEAISHSIADDLVASNPAGEDHAGEHLSAASIEEAGDPVHPAEVAQPAEASQAADAPHSAEVLHSAEVPHVADVPHSVEPVHPAEAVPVEPLAAEPASLTETLHQDTALHALAEEPVAAHEVPAGDAPVPTAADELPGETFHGWASGYKLMAAKEGAATYQPSIAVKFGRLPGTVDLRPLLSPVEDQGEIRSCVATAVAGAYEAWLRKAHKQSEPVSRLFIYYNARWRDGTQDEDEGSAIQLAMESLCRFGACSEANWPCDPNLALKKPGATAYEAAAPYRVADIARVPLKIEAWKQALAEGKPIVFGCELFETFEACSHQGGVVPMPEPAALAHAGHSGHAMCAVGYSDIERVFIVRNSWSADWGDGGYCYMPYAYVMDPTFNDGDCWVFVPKIPAQPPRETWSDATNPITNGGKGVGFPIETHTAAEYAALGVDLFAGARHPYNATILADYASYVTAVSQARWGDLESFDVSTYLAVAAALTDVDLFGDEPLPGAEPGVGASPHPSHEGRAGDDDPGVRVVDEHEAQG